MLKLVPLLLVSGLLSLTSARAQLAHRYDFTDAHRGRDIVGNADGKLAGAATIKGGLLELTGVTGDSLILPSNVGKGITGSFSIELFATRTSTEGGNFSTFFSFSSDQDNFLLFNPDRMGMGSTANFRQSGSNGGAELNVNLKQDPPSFESNTPQHIVLTYDGKTGAITLYNNGHAFANDMLPGFNFEKSAAGEFNGIGGNAPFTTDPSFQGTFSDFRVYTSALTGKQVVALTALGAHASTAKIKAVLAK